MGQKENIIVGLDIGTSKIRAVVGELFRDEIQIIGVGQEISTGIKKGGIVDINATVNAIKKAVTDAELMAACEITEVFAGIAGQHIKGFSGSGVIMTSGSEITEDDVERVTEQAKGLIASKAIPKDSEIIHVIPQEYIVNEQYGIKNPIGMAGGTLEVKVHVVSGPRSFIQNIEKCIEMAGLEVRDIVLESLAASSAVLTEEEKDHGVILLDIGGSSADMSVFSGGNIKYTYVLPLGGSNITKDISIVLNTPLNEAEKLKLTEGECIASKINPDETVSIQSISKKEPKLTYRQVLADIIEKRTEEILTLLKEEIYRMNIKNELSSGIVLTGGSSNLKGLLDLCESVFAMPVKIGSPYQVSGLTDIVKQPEFATAVGLIKYGSSELQRNGFTQRKKGKINNMMRQFIDWFK